MEDLTVIPAAQALVEFGSFRSPDATLREAQAVATAFGKKARAMSLYKKIGESEHLQIEGWQMLAAMYRVTASVESTTFVQFGDAQGWESTACAIYVPTGQKISSADAMCLNDEDKWGMVSKYEWIRPEGGGEKVKTKVGDIAKPLQQLRSMAQTRACSKVLSNLLKWVAKMAGFAGTPAEEMTGSEDTSSQGQQQSSGNGQAPQRSQAAGPVISEAQGKRLFAISKQAGRTPDQQKAILQHFGFTDDREITKDKYEAICAAMQNPQWAPPAPQQQGNSGTVDPWAEVVRAYGGEVKAIAALSQLGFENWPQVNSSDRTAVAMRLIQEAKR